MEKKELQELFCAKLSAEIAHYKKRIQRMGALEIMERSYQITCMLSIYELLIERCREMNEDVLKCLLILPNLHTYFYQKWLKYEDSMQKELEDNIENGIQAILHLGEDDMGIVRKEGKKAA